MNKKSFLYFLFFIISTSSLFGAIGYSTPIDNEGKINIDPINYKMQQLASSSAASSKIFLLNFAFDELKEHIKIDMRDKDLKAIVVNDYFLNENVVVALRDEKGVVKFLDSKELPQSIKQYKSIKKLIVDEKDYTKTILGELSLYYDGKNSDISISNIISLDDDEKSFLSNKKEIKLCADPSWMPFEAVEDGKLIGISAEYVNLFSKILDTPINLVQSKSWAEALNKLKEKKCDIISMAVETNQRKEYLYFTSPYIVTPNVIVTKIGIPFINDIENVKGKRLGVVKDYALHEKLRDKYKDINLVEVDSLEDGLDKVKAGEIFAYIDNSIVVNYHIQKDYLGILTVVGVIDETEKLSIAIRDDEPILRDIFQKVVDLIDENIKQDILNKWIKVNYTVKTDYSLIIQIGIVFLIIIGVIIYWNRKLTFLNKQLSIQRDKANAATKSKSQFLANMSHEIRTPMNGIIGMTELALKADLNDESKEYIKKIDKSTKVLLGIINDILDFSKIEANKLQVEKVEFDLVQTIDTVIDILEYKIKEKNLTLQKEYQIDEEYLYLGDPLRISQIMSNFLTNAIKFTSNGYIKVKIKDLKNGTFQFCVEDTGIGLRLEEQQKLFKPFTQSDESITRQYGGTGLGLAISKQLVNLMGGQIWVESKKDKGSRFYFELKLEKIKKLDDKKVDENINNKPKSLNGLSLLLVEDNFINQEIIIGLLEDKGVMIEVANNGLEAVDLFELNKDRIDLILMDIQMPIMDGIEASKKIRQLDQDIPIVALSANVIEKDNEELKNIKINDYLLKPIDSKRLQSTLLKYMP